MCSSIVGQLRNDGLDSFDLLKIRPYRILQDEATFGASNRLSVAAVLPSQRLLVVVVLILNLNLK